MIFDFNMPYTLDSFKYRGELTMGHLLHIPERILNVIVQIVKSVLFGLATAITFGQSDYLNREFLLAGKRVAINAVGFGTSFLGFFAPINATLWQINVLDALVDPSTIDRTNIPSVLPYALAI